MRAIWARARAAALRERGASMVEYILLISFIAIAALVAVAAFGLQVSDNYSEIVDSIP